MAEPIQSWAEALTQAILTGAPNEPVRAHLDALIRWLSGASSPDANAIDQALIKRNVEPSDVANLALSLLERFLFADGADAFAQLGLTPQTTEAEIRSRYKRLVRVFHPDRQLGDADWLHECTQKLNLALDEALKLTQAPAPSFGQTTAKKPAAAKERYGTRYAGPSKRDQMRAKLGTAQTLQRKVFMILGGLAAFSVFYLWISMPKLSDADNDATAMATTTQPQRKMNLDLQSQPQVSEAPQDKPSEDLLDEIKKAEAQRLAKRVEQEQQALALALAQQKAELEAEKKRLEEEKRILKAQAEAQQQAAARAAKEAEAKRQAELKRQQEESARIAEAKRLAEEKQRAEQKQKQKQQEQKALELALAQQQAAERAAKEAEAKRQAEKEAAEKREREHAAKARLVKDTAAFLKEYVKRYNEGDLDAFIALFTEDARMNHAKGKAAIQKAYVKLFDSTTNRDLKITVMAIQPSDNGADVEVSYVLTYLNSSSSNERLTGEIKFELKAGEEGSKIMSQRF
jgi:TolA protein